MTERFLRLPEVRERVGLSKASIYAKASRGEFPKPIPIGGARCSGWLSSDIDEWIAGCARAAKAQAEGGGGR